MNPDRRAAYMFANRWRSIIQPGGLAETALLSRGRVGRDFAGEIFGELWVLLLLIVLVVGIIAGQPWIVAIAVMSTIVAVVARIWARLSLEDFDFTRQVSQDHMFPGEEFELTLTLENRKPVPLPWLRISEEVPSELDVLNARVSRSDRFDTDTLQDTLSMAWYERVRRTYRLVARRRGFLHFGPATVQSGDLFGLFRSNARIVSRQPVVVFPHIVPLDDFQFPAARPVGDARSRVRLFEDLNRPSGLREYQSGDSMRRIDWKATARLRKPHVRLYDYSVEHSLTLLVDVQTAELAWEGYNRQFLERVVTAAASLASHAIERGFRLGMVSNGIPLSSSGRMVIPPGADPGRLLAILETLAMVRPLSLGRLNAVMDKEPRAIPFGATVVAVSAVLPEGLMRAIDRLVTRGHPALAIYVGDGQPPSAGGRFEVRSMGPEFDVEQEDAEVSLVE